MTGRVRRAGGWRCLHRGSSASLDVHPNTPRRGCSGCPTSPGRTVYRGREGCTGSWEVGGTGRVDCGPGKQDERKGVLVCHDAEPINATQIDADIKQRIKTPK